MHGSEYPTIFFNNSTGQFQLRVTNPRLFDPATASSIQLILHDLNCLSPSSFRLYYFSLSLFFILAAVFLTLSIVFWKMYVVFAIVAAFCLLLILLTPNCFFRGYKSKVMSVVAQHREQLEKHYSISVVLFSISCSKIIFMLRLQLQSISSDPKEKTPIIEISKSDNFLRYINTGEPQPEHFTEESDRQYTPMANFGDKDADFQNAKTSEHSNFELASFNHPEISSDL